MASLEAKSASYSDTNRRIRADHAHIEKPSIWLHITLAISFCGMSACYAYGMISGSENDNGATIRFSICLLIAAFFGFALLLDGVQRSRFLGWDLLLGFIALSGLPGLIVSGDDKWIEGCIFAVMLMIRNWLMFIAVPRSKAAIHTSFPDIVVNWALIGSAIIVIPAFYLAYVHGYSVDSSGRFLIAGMHPNRIGSDCAAGVALCMIARKFPRLIRIGYIAICIWLLIMVQSRTSLFAVGILATLYIGYRLYRLGAVRAILVCSFAATTILLSWVWLSDVQNRLTTLPAINRIIERTERQDPTAGRIERLHEYDVRFDRSPVFGFGYKSNGSYIENGFVSMLMETGVLGFGLYLIFIECTVYVIWRGRRIYGYQQLRRSAGMAAVLLLLVMLRSLGERSHAFQISELAPNGLLVLLGYIVNFRSHKVWRIEEPRWQQITPSK